MLISYSNLLMRNRMDYPGSGRLPNRYKKETTPRLYYKIITTNRNAARAKQHIAVF